MSEIKIKPSRVGTLRALAKKEGAMNSEGKIKVSWLKKKANSSDERIRKKAQFALNARKWN